MKLKKKSIKKILKKTKQIAIKKKPNWIKKINEKTHLFFENEKIEKRDDRKKIHQNPQSLLCCVHR
jgi:hypothetical protein